MKDKSLTAKTYVGFARDKGWIFWTYIGQMLDKDKVKTNARRTRYTTIREVHL